MPILGYRSEVATEPGALNVCLGKPGGWVGSMDALTIANLVLATQYLAAVSCLMSV